MLGKNTATPRWPRAADKFDGHFRVVAWYLRADHQAAIGSWHQQMIFLAQVPVRMTPRWRFAALALSLFSRMVP
jgi:hypothetical protein